MRLCVFASDVYQIGWYLLKNMAGVFDIELHDERVEEEDSDDDAIEIEEVRQLWSQSIFKQIGYGIDKVLI